MELDTVICPVCGKKTPAQPDGTGFCIFCGGKLRGDCAENSNVEYIISQIKSTYAEYNDWVCEYSLKNGGLGKSFAAFFTGNSAFKNHENHENAWAKYYNLCKLLELLKFALLHDRGDCAPEAGWMYLAVEQFFIPLIDGLTDEERADFYARYKLLRRKEPGFQIQSEILKKLKKTRT